jgi:hypothetical protein
VVDRGYLGVNVVAGDAVEKRSWNGQEFGPGLDASGVLQWDTEALDRERAATREFEAEIAYKDLCLQAALDIVRSGAPSMQGLLDVLRAGLAAEQRWREER